METPQANSMCPIRDCTWGLKAPPVPGKGDVKGDTARRLWARQVTALRDHLQEDHSDWWEANAPSSGRLYKDHQNQFVVWPHYPPERVSENEGNLFDLEEEGTQNAPGAPVDDPQTT